MCPRLLCGACLGVLTVLLSCRLMLACLPAKPPYPCFHAAFTSICLSVCLSFLLQAENPLPSTDLGLHIAFGSSKMVPAPRKPGAAAADDGKSGALVERVVQLLQISDSPPTPAEFAEYKGRLAKQAAEARARYGSHRVDPDDSLPTVGELKREHARKTTASRSSGFSAADVARSIVANDRFTVARLKTLPNLAYVRESTTIRLDQVTRRLAEFPEGGPEWRTLKAEADNLAGRLEKIKAEEISRMLAIRAREQERMRAGRDVTGLTSKLNAAVEEHNAAVAEAVSREMRGKTAAQLDAEAEANPFLRRRSTSSVPWKLGLEAAKKRAAAAAAAGVVDVSAAGAAAGSESGSSSVAVSRAPSAPAADAAVSGEVAPVNLDELFGDDGGVDAVTAAANAGGGHADSAARGSDHVGSASRLAAARASISGLSLGAGAGAGAGRSDAASGSSGGSGAGAGAGAGAGDAPDAAAASLTDIFGEQADAAAGTDGAGAGAGAGQKVVSFAEMRRRLAAGGR